LSPDVAQQIVAQPNDVLLYDGELVTQAAGFVQCPTEIDLEQERSPAKLPQRKMSL
jgi:hypothetical protein